MAEKVKVKLLRPLNGAAIGSTANYSSADAKRLEARGAVKIVGKAEAEDDDTDNTNNDRDVKRTAAPANKREAAPANKSK